MTLFNYCINDRPHEQVINAFNQQMGHNLLHKIQSDGLEAEFEAMIDEMVDYIGKDDKRLGEPGFQPDMAYYVKEIFEDDKTEATYDFFSEIGLSIANDISTEEEHIKEPSYVLDKYSSILQETSNWTEMQVQAESHFLEAGFKSDLDFIKAAYEVKPTLKVIDSNKLLALKANKKHIIVGYRYTDSYETLDISDILYYSGLNLDNIPIEIPHMPEIFLKTFVELPVDLAVYTELSIKKIIAKGKSLGIL